MTNKPSKRVTLKEVAKAARVFLASASCAMNNTGSLGEERRQHILNIAKRLGSRQNLSVRATRTGRTGSIGFLVPDMSNPFFPSLAQSVFHRAHENGYSVFMAGPQGDVVWFPINDDSRAGEGGGDVPVVVIDRTLPGHQCIQADYAFGGREAVRHLQAYGHNKIGIVTGPMDVQSMCERCDAARDQIEATGEVALLINNAFSADLDPDAVKAVDSRSATAIFAGADLIAIGIMAHARRIGLGVPRDLSVTGFDDIPWASLSSPSLTTIKMPVDLMLVNVDALMRKISGHEEGAKRVIFDTSVVKRESVAIRK